MNLIYFLLRSSWGMMAIAIITGLLSGTSSASLIALISSAASESTNSHLTSIAWGFAGLALVALITSIISQVMLVQLSQNAVYHLRMRLSNQILASELRHLEQLGNPRLLATLTEDVQSVSNAVYDIPFLCIDIAIVVGCLVYITWLSWTVFMMVLCLILVAVVTNQWLLKRGQKFLALAREDQDLLFNHFRTITEGVKELKLHYGRRQVFLNQDLRGTAATLRRHNVNGLTLFAGSMSWGRLLLFFAIGFVLFALPHLLTISRQTISGYILTFTYLMLPMDNIVNNLPRFIRAGVSLQKIESLGLSLADRAEFSSVPPEIKLSWRCLQLKGVTHTYTHGGEDSSFIIGPIDLTFYRQELVFIVGGNGSGKSTLAKLIAGLYIPEDGEIWLDNQLITEQNREWYRQYFSAVFSDFYLFEELVGTENIDIDIQAQEYLKLLQLDHKVKVENGRLSTTALSQGQRKRLALLTAYLEDRPIYLFDEWAADQDPVFKEIFYTQLLPKLRSRGKTVIAITHDDRYFHVADRIIKLEYGQVIYDKQYSEQER
ncbi:cyclic peptide export ABC transporter [Aetokthonos hydrillicola Thurmond2011]|jgi:putative ATP-binding cassette transporter|uniref:Cyclic peptide export ABC transporter n=1 Tax=Aetokthonos hydrillicola Thurmond2011 TaxID=2712845 RepID=A0AAP5I6E9_9CYAN|nr:cyclic peptide export ABC transporter [Aetokthonos hydrillicola]MBO3461869.1 cyclic peptide export ABC transporter [Aetokthonos hydrillicola CCALA 1050]MBW4586789.1 cyclic peptide export ABC transporter [Aetokthonos hydrillicola CCALA 1050]MDR9895852.1 cyclic peptide export ABC transporter [Aetokthonos hydrillicola Thurmond2011]